MDPRPLAKLAATTTNTPPTMITLTAKAVLEQDPESVRRELVQVAAGGGLARGVVSSRPEPTRKTEDWRHKALCRGPWVDPELWFPDDSNDEQIAKAEIICAVCPVRMECLQLGRHLHRQAGGCHGIFGGHFFGRHRVAVDGQRTARVD